MPVAHDIQTVKPSLFAWQAFEPAVKCDLSSCALETPEGLIFLGPIELAPDAFRRLLEGRKPRAIVLTNGNHSRAAEKFRDILGIAVVAGADATGLDFAPDATLTDGDLAPGGMRVIALPGAGSGEIALVGHGVACLGDSLIHLPPDGFQLLPEKYCEDAGRLRASLRKLLSCDFQVMTFAHGAPLVGTARRQLESLLA